MTKIDEIEKNRYEKTNVKEITREKDERNTDKPTVNTNKI